MSVAGHNGFAVLFRLVGNNLDKVNNELFNIYNFLFKVKFNVNGYLVVTAS